MNGLTIINPAEFKFMWHQSLLTTCAILASFAATNAIAQSSSPKPTAQTPLRYYAARDLATGNSVILDRWMRNAAEQELLLTDSLLETVQPTDSIVLSGLVQKKILCHFILRDYKQTYSTSVAYKQSVIAPAIFRGAAFPELVAYAQWKVQDQNLASTNNHRQYLSILDSIIRQASEPNKRGLMDYLSDRMKYISSYFKRYLQGAGDSLSSKDLTQYFWLYADRILPADINKTILDYTVAHEAKDYIVDEHLKIPLPRGLRLRGMLILPRKFSGPLPVILRVNCYPVENDSEKLRLRRLADSGYAAITVYPRGKGGSEGVFYPFENDAADNYEIIDWISKQDWCNGNIGMYGGSYLGFAQWATLKKKHPALKTIVPQVAVGVGIDYPNPNGVFLTYMLQWIKYVRNETFSDSRSFSDARKWERVNKDYLLKGIPFKDLDSLEGSGLDTVYQRWLHHPGYDQYWQQMTPTADEFRKIDIPILTTTGFFDDDQRGAIYYYNRHHQFGNKEAVNKHHLLIGPYDHASGQGGVVKPMISSYRIDSAAMIGLNDIVLQWFNYTLRGGKKPEFLKDRVSVFVLGENKWRYFPSVQAMAKDTLQYRLDAGSPSIKDSGQLLSNGKIPSGRFADLHFSTVPGSMDTIDVFSMYDGKIVNNVFKKNEILQFRSAVLEKDITISGSFMADLYLSLTAPDADLFIGIWELSSDGQRWPLSQTYQRLSFSQDKSVRKLLQKNKVYRVVFDQAHWITKRISKGSRLLFVIASLTGTYFQKNYGSGKPTSAENGNDGREIKLTIHTTTRYPSAIRVPVL